MIYLIEQIFEFTFFKKEKSKLIKTWFHAFSSQTGYNRVKLLLLFDYTIKFLG